MPDTLLVLSGLGVPPYSARGLTQTLEPIGGSGVFERDINGTLVNLSVPQFLKYHSTITCEDVEAPAFNAPPIGAVVTVDCVAELAYLTSIGSGGSDREVVSGSERVVGDWTYYRPSLSMIVVSFSASRDEYGHMTSWQLELEES